MALVLKSVASDSVKRAEAQRMAGVRRRLRMTRVKNPKVLWRSEDVDFYEGGSLTIRRFPRRIVARRLVMVRQKALWDRWLWPDWGRWAVRMA